MHIISTLPWPITLRFPRTYEKDTRVCTAEFSTDVLFWDSGSWRKAEFMTFSTGAM